MPSKPNIIDVITSPRLVGDALSPAQEVALRALYGLSLDDEQFAIFQRATGRDAYEPREYREASYILRQKAGKSSKLSASIAVYEAAFRQRELPRRERGYVVPLAPTRRQAGVVVRLHLEPLRGFARSPPPDRRRAACRRA